LTTIIVNIGGVGIGVAYSLDPILNMQHVMQEILLDIHHDMQQNTQHHQLCWYQCHQIGVYFLLLLDIHAKQQNCHRIGCNL